MNPETKNCESCKMDFVIETDDFSFYEKMGVLPPKKCPDCRSQLRLNFRNERSFYKRECDKCKKPFIGQFSSNKTYPVWCHDCWFADDWSGKDFALEYDPSRPFLEQWKELWESVPKPGTISTRDEGCEYVNYVADNKHCYFLIESSNNEDAIHCYWIQLSKDLVDCSYTQKVERSYDSDDCYDSYNLKYCKGAHSCTDSAFLLNSRGCMNCLGCINLRQQQYCIFNEQYTKEEYEKKLAEYRLDTHSGVEKFRKEFEAFIAGKPRKFAEIYNVLNSTGNYMTNVKNVRHSFHSYDAEECAYSIHAWRGAKECVDCNTAGRGAELLYNTMNTGLDAANIVCGSFCWGSQFMDYCVNCPDSQNALGCVGYRKAKYAILNKPYEKDEYEKLRAEIIEKMKQEGVYGEFYPPEFSAFGYNETSAMIEYPLTKEEALSKGFKWEDTPRGTFGKATIAWADVPDSIGKTSPDIVKEIFECTKCQKNYRVIGNEFSFYQKCGIPLPRLCPECRHERRIVARGPNKLWHRKCMNSGCENEFETNYAPERPEILYCEDCYQKEIL
ncbi:MAG: hypothetical protein KA052_01415 [Candidatus Pacebacteria bacterium]|nr:hypothetical protein [Candidatus Paceibacterota bacterium]